VPADKTGCARDENLFHGIHFESKSQITRRQLEAKRSRRQ
jgi:hypothetical protein